MLAVALVLTGVIDLTGRSADSDRPVVPAPQGTLVLRATPWAEIVEITDAGGRQVDIGGSKFTPQALQLAPGAYRVVLRNGSSGDTTVEVEVEADTTTSEVVALAEHDVDELLRSLRLIE